MVRVQDNGKSRDHSQSRHTPSLAKLHQISLTFITSQKHAQSREGLPMLAYSCKLSLSFTNFRLVLQGLAKFRQNITKFRQVFK